MFKSLDGKFLVKHLDKIILGFIAFKIGLVGIFLGISKMLWGLIKGPFKFFGAGSKMGNFGMAGKMGRGLLGTKDVAGGARAGGFLGKGGKLFKGFKGMGGKMLGGAGLAFSAIELGTDIWDAFTKKGVKQKKAFGGALGGAVGGGIGFFLGGPIGAALGHQLGRWIGKTAADKMATASDLTITRLEDNLAAVQLKLKESKGVEDTLSDEMALVIQEVGVRFNRVAQSLNDRLTSDTKLGDLSSKETGILEQVFGPDIMSNQAKFAAALTAFLNKKPEQKFKELLDGASRAAGALIDTATSSLKFQKAQSTLNMTKMQEELLQGEQEFLKGMTSKKISEAGAEQLLGTVSADKFEKYKYMDSRGNQQMGSDIDRNRLGKFMFGLKDKSGQYSGRVKHAFGNETMMNDELIPIIKNALKHSLGPAFTSQIEGFMAQSVTGDFADLGGFEQVLDSFSTWANTTHEQRKLELSQLRVTALNTQILEINKLNEDKVNNPPEEKFKKVVDGAVKVISQTGQVDPSIQPVDAVTMDNINKALTGVGIDMQNLDPLSVEAVINLPTEYKPVYAQSEENRKQVVAGQITETTPTQNKQHEGLLTNAPVISTDVALLHHINQIDSGIKEMNTTLKEMNRDGVGVYKQ
jgi:hypothetical protein